MWQAGARIHDKKHVKRSGLTDWEKLTRMKQQRVNPCPAPEQPGSAGSGAWGSLQGKHLGRWDSGSKGNPVFCPAAARLPWKNAAVSKNPVH